MILQKLQLIAKNPFCLIFLAFLIIFPSCTKPIVYEKNISTNNSNEASLLSKSVSYTGEQLFRGLFLFEGQVTKQISYFDPIRKQISQLSDSLQTLRLQLNDEIVNQVKLLNPNFFNELKAEISSDNFNRIDSVMEKGAGLAMSALLNTPTYNSYYNQDSTQSYYTKGNSIINKMDVSKYNLDSIGGINQYLVDFLNKQEANKANIIPPDKAACILITVVLALAVLDVVAAVNDAAVVNVLGVALAIVAVYARVVFWSRSTQQFNSKASSLEREKIVVQIAQNL
ncbi:MAG: hypothetical protein ACR2FN_01095 [Chitinophagaceae bacterium]